jgi:predicted small lipoprotein YifL
MKKIGSSLKITAILASLAGCASEPPLAQYAGPEDAATSNLKSEIGGGGGRNESINVYVTEGRCGDAKRKKLFNIRDSKSNPAGFVKIAANQPLRLEYIETASGGRTCNISLDVDFESGKSYSLVGGFAYKSGPIPILTGTRMCQFGVQDDADKTLVSRKSTCEQ